MTAKIALVAACLAALAAPGASGAELPPGYSRANPFPSPGAFYVRGSHGYNVGVVADTDLGREPHSVYVVAQDRAGRAIYHVAASFRDDRIHANLGRFGRVALAWHPNGRVGTRILRCPEFHTRLYMAEGSYVGSFEFKGEHGFTAARTRRVSGNTGWFAHLGCSVTVSEGFPGSGVLLEAFKYSGREPKGSYRALSLVQNKPGERIPVFAQEGERRGRISIARQASAYGRPRIFSVEESLDSATLSPPPPFAGSASFERVEKGKPGRWTGDLTVDFPGDPEVPLAGKNFGARLMHGFREVSERHP